MVTKPFEIYLANLNPKKGHEVGKTRPRCGGAQRIDARHPVNQHCLSAHHPTLPRNPAQGSYPAQRIPHNRTHRAQRRHRRSNSKHRQSTTHQKIGRIAQRTSRATSKKLTDDLGRLDPYSPCKRLYKSSPCCLAVSLAISYPASA